MNGTRVFVIASLLLAAGAAIAWDRLQPRWTEAAEARPSDDRLLILSMGGGTAPRAPAPRRNARSTSRRDHSAESSRGIPAAGKVYRVRAGDSLSSIARRTLGSAARWREIADLNGLTSPDLLRPGQELLLP